MSYVTTRDKVSLYVKDWGQGRPVVLAHGYALSLTLDGPIIKLASFKRFMA